MSVFWDEGRAGEAFCRAARKPTAGQVSPSIPFQTDPDQLLRVSINVAFRRARLKSVYSVLRGKDLETEQFSPERRVAQFDYEVGAGSGAEPSILTTSSRPSIFGLSQRTDDQLE
jgi:hypothetical protein